MTVAFGCVEEITPIDAGNLVEELEKAAFPTPAKSSYWIPLIPPATGSADSKAAVSIFTAKRASLNFRVQAVVDVAEIGKVPHIVTWMFSMGWRFQKEAVEMTGLSLSVGVAVADSLRNLSGAPVGLNGPMIFGAVTANSAVF